MNEIIAVTRKEIITLVRAKVTFSNAIIMPFLMLLLFVYTLSGRVQDVPIAIVDLDQSSLSRQVVDGFSSSQYFTYIGQVANEADLRSWLDEGRIRAGLLIPQGLDEAVERRERSEVLVLIDGSETTVAAATLNEIKRLGLGLTTQLMPEPRPSPPDSSGILSFNSRVLYTNAAEDLNFIVPGILGWVLFFLSLNVVALEIAKEREVGTIEQINVSPIRPYAFILGKSIPYLILFLFEVPLLLLAAYLFFSVEIAGSVALVLLLSSLLVIVSVSLALMISSSAPNQREADNMANFITLPTLLLSGAIFPLEKMPAAGKVIAELLPVTHYLRAVRAVMLKGVGLNVIQMDALILAAYALIFGGASVFLFRKTVKA